MARVPGLTPVQQEGQQSSRRIRSRQSSPNANNLRPAPLRPQAQPVDTYSRPEAPLQTNGLLQLAETLAAINPALQRFAATLEEQREKDSRWRAMKYLQTTPEAEWRERMKRGDVPEELQTPVAEDVFGEHLAAADARKLQEAYMTEYDPAQEDPEEFFRRMTADTYERYGENPAIMDAYTRNIEKVRQNILNGALEARRKEVMEQRRGDVFEAYRGRIEQARRDGTPVTDAVKSIYDDFQKNSDFLKIHPKEQMEMTLQLATQLATEGDFEAAKALLQHERKNGPYKGSLLTDMNTADRATKLWARIEDEERKVELAKIAEEAEEQLYGNLVEMAKNGSLINIGDQTVPDKKGEMKLIPRETAIKETGKRLVDEIGKEAAYATRTPEQAQEYAEQMEMQVFAHGGLRHPYWFDQMDAVPTMVTQSGITGKINPSAVAGFKRYRKLNVEAPEYLGAHAKRGTIEFLDAANWAMDMGLAENEEDALRWAFHRHKDLNPQHEAFQIKYDALRDQVSEAISNSTGWFFGPKRATNETYVANEIARSATNFALITGASDEDALEMARKQFEKTHINILGTYVRNDRRYPPNFPDLVVKYVNQWAEKHKDDYAFDPDELTVMPVNRGAGGFEIRGKDRMPIPLPGVNTFFSLEDILGMEERERDEKMEDVVKNHPSNR